LNRTRWRSIAVSIPLSLLLEVEKAFQISFLPSDSGDAYRLRNIKVVLRLTNGAELSSATLAREYATRRPGKSAAQPIRLLVNVLVE